MTASLIYLEEEGLKVIRPVLNRFPVGSMDDLGLFAGALPSARPLIILRGQSPLPLDWLQPPPQKIIFFSPHLRDSPTFEYACFGTLSLDTVGSGSNTPEIVGAAQLHEGGIGMGLELLEEILQKADRVHVCIEMDCFAAPYAPGVARPQVLGLLPWHVLPLLQALVLSEKVSTYEIGGLDPLKDKEQITVELVAGLIGTILKPREL